MEKVVMQSLLYDFYGELLNEHQREVYEDYLFNDIGLSEIAEERGISRQGVHDLVKRCEKALEDYEGKLHLVEKFERTRAMAARINALCGDFGKGRDRELAEEIKAIAVRISGDILDEL